MRFCERSGVVSRVGIGYLSPRRASSEAESDAIPQRFGRIALRANRSSPANDESGERGIGGIFSILPQD